MHVEAAAVEAAPAPPGAAVEPPALSPALERGTQTRRLALVATACASLPALLYALLRPPSFDLPADMLRAHLFSLEGFGLWNNLWYGGHPTPGYSLLWPAAAAALGPQAAGALAGALCAPLLALLAAPLGRQARLGAAWLGLATAVDLLTGRLTFALGLLPAAAALLALVRGRARMAAAAAALSALCSPVAALFCALACLAVAGAAGWEGQARAVPGKGRLRSSRSTDVRAAVLAAAAALLPFLALNLAFPERGSEPFAFSVLWPILLLSVGGALWLPPWWVAVRIGCVLYGALCLLAYLVPSALGSNAARLAPLVAGPLAALAWWPRRRRLLALLALPLLYLQWQAPLRDLLETTAQPSAQSGFYRPLLAFLQRQHGSPFRVEIPFTATHAEAFYVASRVPLARGWERQADRADDALFYRRRLGSTAYRRWLDDLAVRFVAVPIAPLDPSAEAEAALIRRGLPYLRLTFRSRDWRVYAVRDPAPLAAGAAVARGLGPESVSLRVLRPGSALVRVRFSPFWRLEGVRGCVSDRGGWVLVVARTSGRSRLAMAFAPGRIGASSRRCTD